MTRAVIGLAGAAALLCAPAWAADMATKAPPIVPAPPFSWTGFYIGGTAGADWNDPKVTLDPVNGANPNYRPQDLAGVAAFGTGTIRGTSAIVGGKVGYNQQYGAWVAGVEADLSAFHFNKTAVASGNPFPGFGNGSMVLTRNVTSDWLATIRPRFGYAVDRALFYATGGVAFGRVGFSNTDVEFAPLGNGFGTEASSASQVRTGWVAGGGIDYALSANWICSIEYLHVDLGSLNASGLVSSANLDTATLNFSTKLQSDIVRAGVAYKF